MSTGEDHYHVHEMTNNEKLLLKGSIHFLTLSVCLKPVSSWPSSYPITPHQLPTITQTSLQKNPIWSPRRQRNVSMLMMIHKVPDDDRVTNEKKP